MTLRDRYPDADILAQRAHWDDATRDVVLDRVHNVPEFRYFDVRQQATLEALCARVVTQDHRPSDRRVPIAPWIDARCDRRVVDGFRFEDMPPNEVAWTWGLEGLDQTATSMFSRDFVALDGGRQDEVLRAIGGGEPTGEVWSRMPARRWWIHIALRQLTGAYYAHPYAWDEIGFGGPAYPRGYASLNFGAPEPWEPREVPTEIPHARKRGRAGSLGGVFDGGRGRGNGGSKAGESVAREMPASQPPPAGGRSPSTSASAHDPEPGTRNPGLGTRNPEPEVEP